MRESRRRTGAWLVPLGLLLGACAPRAQAPAGPELAWDIAPRPASVGPARISFSLTDADGAPVAARDVEVEANMSHPGMVPEFAEVRELEPGRFEADLELSMGGDWFLLFRGQAAEGNEFELRADLPGVLSK